MRNQTQIFAHKFDSLETARFDIRDYSKLKFGSNQAARRMGQTLAVSFYDLVVKNMPEEEFVVIPSPYNHVHNAATMMTNQFINFLNLLLLNHKGSRAVELDTIHRKVSYINDYGFLDKASRKKLIDGDTFYCNKDFWGNKKLIFIDDVNITGTHEDKLIEILDENKVTNDVYFLYFAKYTGNQADTEAKLNFNHINTTDAFVKMINEERDAQCLVRPIKYLMGQAPEEFKIILSRLPHQYVEALFFGCLGEGYDKIEKYSENFVFLHRYFNQHIL